MEELSMLREVFGPDEVPTVAARDQARTALLNRIRAGEATVRPERRRRGRRWSIRMGLAAAVAAAAVAGVVVVENLGTVDEQGNNRTAFPLAQRAAAAEFLENAAVAATRKAWTTPRPEQFMYKESRELRNSKELEERAPNGPLVPGSTRVVVQQIWKRIDGQVLGRMSDGQLVVDHKGGPMNWAQIPFGDLAKLTTPEAVLAWDKAPKNVGAELDAVLGQYVLPPAVEAAFFRALAQREGTRLNPDMVNIDGRSAVGLSLTIEGYISNELLFDKETYTLIGERSMVIADHTGEGLDGTTHFHKGDVLRQAVYTASIIVNNVGDTK